MAPNQMQIFSLEGSSVRAGWERLPRTHPYRFRFTNPGRFATRILVLFVAATQQQKEQGEREMALKLCTNTLVPRATSELFAFYFNNAATPVFISCSTSVLPFDF